MSSKDQEILRLQAELARLQAEVANLQEENIVLQQKSSALSQKGLEKDKKIVEMDKKIESMQATIDSLQNMMAWFRKKMFGSMSEKNLPLDPSVLELRSSTYHYQRMSRPPLMQRSKGWRSRTQRLSR